MCVCVVVGAHLDAPAMLIVSPVIATAPAIPASMGTLNSRPESDATDHSCWRFASIRYTVHACASTIAARASTDSQPPRATERVGGPSAYLGSAA